MKTISRITCIILTILLFNSCRKDKPTIPLITTRVVTEISTTSAVSGGDVTNEGGAILISKGICWNTSTDPTLDHNKTSETGESGSFSSFITQLAPNTTYFVRAYATNIAGTGYGKSESFKTLGDKPLSNSVDASNIQLNSATLNGTVNPNSLPTSVTFEYGTTIGYGSTITATQSPITGNTTANVSADLSGLAPGTTYHFRIKGENSLGITYSDDLTFTTLGKVPTAVALSATDLQINSSTLNGSLNANYLSTTAIFEWGTTTTYGNTATVIQSPVTGNSVVNISANLSGLAPGTTYHFRIKAENSLGITYSTDVSFTTLGHAPSCSAHTEANIGSSSVTLSGSVNPNYLSTSVIFEYGIDSNYGSTVTAIQSPIAGSTEVTVSANLTGLSEYTVFHYRVKAENVLGISTTDDKTFLTGGVLTDVDGNTYKAVLIGNQKWMAENLKTKHYSDGATILNGESVSDNCDSNPYYFNYNKDPNNTSTYGLLYNYYAASRSTTIEPQSSTSIPSGIQGACPTGWHIPSFPEMEVLINTLGGQQIAGSSLKSTLLWDSPNVGATNSSNFNALPAGGYDKLNFNYGYLGQTTFIWSTTGNGTDYFRGMRLYYSSQDAPLNFVSHRCTGYSIRCLKD